MTLVIVDACPNASVKKEDRKHPTLEMLDEQPPLDGNASNFIIDDLDKEFEDLDTAPLRLRAYTQGNFDHFCGIYAIINALRIATHSYNRDLYVNWSKLFAAIINHIDSQALLGKVTLHGLTRDQHQSCLKAAADYLKLHHDLSVSWAWPWLGRRSRSKKRMAADLRQHLEGVGTSVILHFINWGQTHWTTVDTVSSGSLSLTDSAKSFDIKVSDLWFTKAKAEPILYHFSLDQYGALNITMSGGAIPSCSQAPPVRV